MGAMPFFLPTIRLAAWRQKLENSSTRLSYCNLGDKATFQFAFNRSSPWPCGSSWKTLASWKSRIAPSFNHQLCRF
jgi:hypothetical protein